MGIKVVKFGGSSLADAERFRTVKEIVTSDPDRKFVVPSAPGKRFKEDVKVTDLLYKCYSAVSRSMPMDEHFDRIIDRYTQIAEELGVDYDIMGMLIDTRDAMLENVNPDFYASRGEYMNGRLLAAYLGWDFIDPADFIKFDRHGTFASEWTNETLAEELVKHERAVIPGFYGSFPNGDVHTFPRGGSDITGAVVARAAGADVYENWTDVSGFLMCDPRIVDNPKPIETITYRELRELSYMGAAVLHEDAVFPVRQAGIPINIRNTNAPEDEGTMIVHHLPEGFKPKIITGIAGNHQFSVVRIEKAMMNNEIGFGAKVLQIFADFGLSFEHMPSGIDTLSVVVATDKLRPVKVELMKRIQKETNPDVIYAEDEMAIIAVVGYGMVATKGTAARVLSAVSKADINIRMIDQGSGELNIIIGVHEKDYVKAINSLYKEFEAEL